MNECECERRWGYGKGVDVYSWVSLDHSSYSSWDLEGVTSSSGAGSSTSSVTVSSSVMAPPLSDSVSSSSFSELYFLVVTVSP
mmetsp:Transcript_22135/g.26099  ORF Transcript_22135/g.26099 Transcript_22135/m.26099 type:complete len:83 (+) Transcript_22135:286-534(+)